MITISLKNAQRDAALKSIRAHTADEYLAAASTCRTIANIKRQLADTRRKNEDAENRQAVFLLDDTAHDLDMGADALLVLAKLVK